MYPCPPIVTSNRSAIGRLRHYPRARTLGPLAPLSQNWERVGGEGAPLVLPPGIGGAGGGRYPTNASLRNCRQRRSACAYARRAASSAASTGCPPPRRFAAAISRR